MHNMAATSDLFGATAGLYLALLQDIAPSLAGTRYEFMPEDEFYRVGRADIKAVPRVYWYEILARAHLAAGSSIGRGCRWLDGAIAAGFTGNLLAFAACLRGFLEAAADSYDALGVVPSTLAEHHRGIKDALEGRARVVAVGPELEEVLIHFTSARRVPRGESAPNTHRAKTTREYLASLVDAHVPRVEDLYAELCEFTHPAARSLDHFCTSADGRNYLFRVDLEKLVIARLLTEYAETYLRLFMFGFNPAVLILAVLRDFPIQEFHSLALSHWDLSGISGWSRVQGLLKK
jgi:hypothetical protein